MRQISRTACIAFSILVLFSVISPLFAQQTDEEEKPLPMYGLGDQMFAINLGLFIPLFFYNPNPGVDPIDRVKATNLSPGGIGSLEWAAFLNDKVSLGAEIQGMFSISPLKRTLLMIPITAKLSYFLRAYPFDFPLFIGAGVNFAKLEDELFVGPILKPGFAAYWNINSEWSLGLRVIYWWVPQIYLNDPLKDDTRLGNFLETTLSALYHF